MTPGNAKVLGLAAIVTCSALVIYRGRGFDPRRVASIALLGAAILFVATFAPQVAAGASGLLIADALVLSPGGVGVIDGLGKTVLPGATVKPGMSASVGHEGTHGPGGAHGGSSTAGSSSAKPGILHGIDDFLHGTTGWQQAVAGQLGKKAISF